MRKKKTTTITTKTKTKHNAKTKKMQELTFGWPIISMPYSFGMKAFPCK